MVKKTKKQKKSNPIAKDLRTSKYKQRLIANTKTYNRKKYIVQKSSLKEF